MYFTWILLLTVVCLLFLLFLNYRSNKAKKQAENEILSGWAKVKTGQYFNFFLIGRYFENKTKSEVDFFQVITDKISDDLYLNEVFKVVDRTVSKVGQQFLYYKLRTIQKDIAKLQRFDKLVEAFQQNKTLRVQSQLQLKALEKGDAYYLEELLHGEPIQPPKWYPLVSALSFSVFALIGFSFIFPVLLLLVLPLFMVNIFIHYWNKENINYYLIALGEFGKAYKVATQLSRSETILSSFKGADFLMQLSPLKKKMKWVNLSNTFESDSTTIFYSIFELLKIAFNLEILFFFALIRNIEEKAKPLDELFQFIGEIDAAISTASFRCGLPEYCKPAFCSPKHLKVESLRHPLIVDCVPNELLLDQKSLLLTGSNMSGKTTFIRSVGINVLLAQTLYTCTAKVFEVPFSKLYTSIKITDDLLTEKSYYFEEVTTIKNFIDNSHSEDPAIFIMDEIFKGTNTVERISGGKAILSYLSRDNHLVFVSTHDIELTELLENQFVLYHFSESVQESRLLFDHKLKYGPLTTRNAIKILEISQYPGEIIAEANNIVNKLESSYN